MLCKTIIDSLFHLPLSFNSGVPKKILLRWQTRVRIQMSFSRNDCLGHTTGHILESSVSILWSLEHYYTLVLRQSRELLVLKWPIIALLYQELFCQREISTQELSIINNSSNSYGKYTRQILSNMIRSLGIKAMTNMSEWSLIFQTDGVLGFWGFA